MKDSTVTLRIKAIDEATPVIRRLHRQFWWMAYGPLAVTMLWVATVVLAFLLGLLVDPA